MPLVVVRKASPEDGLDAEAVREIEDAFRTWVDILQGGFTDDDVAGALLSGHGSALVTSPMWGASWDKVRERVERAMRGALARSGTEALAGAGIGMGFTVDNPFATAAAARQEAVLARRVLAGGHAAIREAVERGFIEGFAPREMARIIKPSLGTLPRDAATLRNNARRMKDAGASPEQIARATESFAERLQQRRAENIARTETITSQNVGQHEAFQSAQAEGLILPQSKRRWVAGMQSDRTCPVCRSLHGQERELNEPFVDLKGRSIMYPPAHPSCRCRVVLVTVIPGRTAPVPTLPADTPVLPSRAMRGMG